MFQSKEDEEYSNRSVFKVNSDNLQMGDSMQAQTHQQYRTRN